MHPKSILLSIAFVLSIIDTKPGIANDFKHCTWNGKAIACRATKTTDGYEIYYPNGGASQKIIFAGGNKVWIINDGVKEPGTIEGRTIKRLTDGTVFSF